MCWLAMPIGAGILNWVLASPFTITREQLIFKTIYFVNLSTQTETITKICSLEHKSQQELHHQWICRLHQHMQECIKQQMLQTVLNVLLYIFIINTSHTFLTVYLHVSCISINHHIEIWVSTSGYMGKLSMLVKEAFK